MSPKNNTKIMYLPPQVIKNESNKVSGADFSPINFLHFGSNYNGIYVPICYMSSQYLVWCVPGRV